jgi:hypothetical protein
VDGELMDFLKTADSIAAMTPKNVVQTDSVLLQREMRGRASVADKLKMLAIEIANRVSG